MRTIRNWITEFVQQLPLGFIRHNGRDSLLLMIFIILLNFNLVNEVISESSINSTIYNKSKSSNSSNDKVIASVKATDTANQVNNNNAHKYAHTISWFSNTNGHVKLRVDLFLSSACRYCQQADVFFNELQKQKPWLEINRYVIDQNKDDLIYFNKELEIVYDDDYAIPAFFFCNSHWMGFSGRDTTGKVLAKALDYCRSKIITNQQLTKSTIKILNQWANAAKLQLRLEPTNTGYIPLKLVLYDISNPCSLFLLVIFFAALWIAQTKSMQINTSIIFLVSLASAHFFHQTELSYLVQHALMLRIVAITCGFGLLLFMIKIYFKKIANLAKDLWLWVPIVIIVEYYQQSCKNNVALVYEQWLSMQHYNTLVRLFYELAYQIMYILPLTVVTLIFIFFGKRQWLGQYVLVINRAAIYYLVTICLYLIINPASLAYPALSWLTIMLVAILAFFLKILIP